MKLRMCQCRMCKYGRKDRHEQYRIRHMKSAYRSKVKRLLHKGEYANLPQAIPVGYTD